MTNATAGFTLDTLVRKKIEKLRRKEKDARLHNRLSALLWLGQARTPEEIAELLGICPRTVRNWLQLYQRGGLETLRTLEYKGDPG
ncbi:MAG: helix-turn-helix domain-containing protein [Terriglobales bacterium]